jgi:hypothetical protein
MVELFEGQRDQKRWGYNKSQREYAGLHGIERRKKRQKQCGEASW